MNATQIPYGRQSISEDDIRAIIEVLRSDWLTQGPAVKRFEETVAGYCGAAHAVAANSATSALHLGCRALGLGPGDRLWTSPNTFVASANCGLYCGAQVDFVDIDPLTYNMCPTALERKLEIAAQEDRLPKVVIPVHFAGCPCDMAAIGALAKQYGFFVIEDASHAIGSRYRGAKTGSCAYSDLTVFSFHPVKIVTTGEGGMVLTNRPELYEALERLRSHGITRDPRCMAGDSEGPWYYEQIELGYNYRLTDLQAALGASQMGRLDEFVRRRHFLADRYGALLSHLPLQVPRQAADAYSAWHLYVIRLDLGRIGKSRRKVFEALRAAGIGVNVHYIPVHRQPCYQSLGFRAGDFPEAERYYQEAISLPLFPALSEWDQERVVAALKEALR